MNNNLISLFDKAYSPLFNILVTIIASRIFGVDEVGNLALVFIFSVVGQFIVSRGVDQDIQVFYASHRGDDLFRLVFSEIKRRLVLLLLTSLVVLIIYLVFKIFTIKLQLISLGFFGVLLGTISACSVPNEIQLIVKNKFRKLVTLKYLSGIIGMLTCFYLIFLVGSGIKALFFTLILEKSLYLIFHLIVSSFFQGARRFSYPYSAQDIPMVNIYTLVSSVAILGYSRLDQIYIYTTLSSGSLGIYSTTAKFFEVANIATMALISSKLHIIANRSSSHELVLIAERKLFRVSVILISCIALMSSFWLKTLFNMSSDEGSAYAYILAIGTVCGAIGAIKGPWVAKNKLYGFNMLFTIIGSLSSLLVMLALRPNSLAGVASVFALGQFIVNIICPIFFQHERAYLISIFGWNKK